MEKINVAIKIEANGTAGNAALHTLKPKSKNAMICKQPAIKVLRTNDYKAAAACLASAFEDDPASTYFLDCPDMADWTDSQKWALHLKIFECAVYAHILNGLALGVPSSSPNGGFDAVALWMGPGRNMDDFWTLFRSGFWRLNWCFSAEGRKRFYDEFLPLLHDTKAQVLGEKDDKSWYLVYLGTKSEARGKGLARLLIEAGTEKADAANMPCYLESSHSVNVPYYARLGFEKRTTVQLKEGKRACLDIMVREPQSKA